MAGNTEVVDEVVDPKAVKQVEDLTAASNRLEKQFIDTLKAAIELNKITGASSTNGSFAKNADASTKATKTVVDNQEKVRLSEIRLQQAREKSFDDYEKKMARKESTSAKSAANEERRRAKQFADSIKQLNQIEKEVAAAEKLARPYNLLSKQLDEARAKAKDLYLQFGPNSEEFLRAQAGVNRLNTQISTIDGSLGQYQRNVGNYVRNVTVVGQQSENAFGAVGQGLSRAFGILRTAAYILPGLGIAGIFNIIFDGVGKLAEKLELFSTIATKAEIRQKALNDAFASADYSKAIENVNSLKTNIELANAGFLDKDKVIDQYNESIGRVAGSVDTLDEAEQGLVKNAPDFLKITLLKAAAQLALADAAKKTYEAQQIANKKIEEFGSISQDVIADQNRGGILSLINPVLFGSNEEELSNRIDTIRSQRRAEQVADTTAQANKFLGIADKFQKDAALIAKKNNFSDILTGSGGGVSSTASLRNDINNQRLELAKKTASAIIENDKLSYSKRLSAQKDFDNASKEILNNNYKLALTEKGLSKNQIEKLTQQQQLEIFDIESSGLKKRRDLNSQASKDLINNYKAELERRKSNEELVMSDITKSYQDRFNAIDKYENLSRKLVKVSANEQVKDAGENSIKIKGIKQQEQSDLNKIDIDGNKKREALQKEVNTYIQKQMEELQKMRNASLSQELSDFRDAQNKKLLEIDKYKSDAISKLTDLYAQGKVSDAQYNQQLYDIEQGAAEKRIQIQLDATAKIIEAQAAALALGFGSAADLQKSTDEFTKIQISASDLATKKQIDNINKLKQAKQELHSLERSLADASITLIQTIVEGGYQRQIDALKQQSETVAENADIEKQAVNNSLSTNEEKARRNRIIDAETSARQKQLADEEKKIRSEQAVFEKAINVARIIEATALAEVQALTYLSNPLTAPLYPAIATLIATLGAVQLATVLAQPIPKYKDGTTNHKGGLAILGDGGGMELVQQPNGLTYLSPATDTLMNLPQGTTVVPHLETMGLLGASAKNYAGGEQISNRELAALMRENNKYQKQIAGKKSNTTANGWYGEMMGANNWNGYMNRYFK